MRGYQTISKRAGAKPMPRNEATALTYNLSAPYKGWNARGNLANMDPREAIQLDNIFPNVQDVELRKGSIDWVTGFSAKVEALLPYSGGSLNKLFAASDSGIYDVTASGAVGAVVAACTNGAWFSLNFSTAGGNFLFAVNGTDLAKTFDGTTWAVPAITGVTSSTISQITSHQKRIWMVEANTMNLWYLPVESIAGAATKFPVGSLFKLGGYVVAVGSWTLDSGSGMNDIFVIVTSNGEIAAYQGTDPASSATWSLSGVYVASRPLGTQPLLDYGGDLLYLGQNGLIPVSQLVQSTLIDRSRAVSYSIDGAFLEAAETYSGNRGWQMITHKTANLLIVNIPVSQDTLSYQYVMNTITKAWCRFTGWNAACWATVGDDIYFAGGSKVYKAWQGLSDSGVAITGTVFQAYAALGLRGQKEVTLVRPYIGLSNSAQISYALDADFATFDGQSVINYASTSTGAVWGTSLWNTGVWDAGTVTFQSSWLTVPGDLGDLHSFRLQITTSTSTFTWTSTDYAYKPAGIL